MGLPLHFMILKICFFSFGIFSLFSCSKNQGSPQTQEDLVAQGRAIYTTQCTICHHPDPTKDGPVGPAISGSSKELVEARLLHQSYPPGYQPKRPTHVMPAFPYLQKDIEALVLFLESSAQL
ncbi:MAG TPA: hypothetical protein DDW49_07215 [Deltaproteobacteria bacterium]|nr:MAG: hypothetical protein A2048_04870 [Deltaproteobacteria bacterium GWA2_45_12]HBF13159.1 hypothetical protein [Deltaproteobacteria bacterium]